MLPCYCMIRVSPKPGVNAVPCLPPRTMNYSWWHTRPLWNRSRNPRASAVACSPLQMPSRKRWKEGVGKDVYTVLKVWLTLWGFMIRYCWACDFMKTSSCCQLFKLTFLADNLSKLFFLIIVHGLKDSLHSTGDLNNSARKIHQWCAPAAGGGGGESSKSCASSAEI